MGSNPTRSRAWSNPPPLLHGKRHEFVRFGNGRRVVTSTRGGNACDHRIHLPVQAPDLLNAVCDMLACRSPPSACYLCLETTQMHDEKPPRRQAGQREAVNESSWSKPAGPGTKPGTNRWRSQARECCVTRVAPGSTMPRREQKRVSAREGMWRVRTS